MVAMRAARSSAVIPVGGAMRRCRTCAICVATACDGSGRGVTMAILLRGMGAAGASWTWDFFARGVLAGQLMCVNLAVVMGCDGVGKGATMATPWTEMGALLFVKWRLGGPALEWGGWMPAELCAATGCDWGQSCATTATRGGGMAALRTAPSKGATSASD
jgi:hypothetical protein